MSRLRLGVALVVGGPPGAELDVLRRALGDGALGRIPPHITLVPPINVRTEEVDNAVGMVRQAAAATPPLRLRLGPMATFWPSTPVVYLAVGGDVDGLGGLRDAVFTGALARPLTWPFVPHVTIGEDVEPTHIPAIVAALGPYRSEITVDRVGVLQQHDDRRWRVMAEAVLGGGRVVGRGGLEVELTAGEAPDAEAAYFLARTWAAHVEASYGPVPPARPFVVTARREGELVGVATGGIDDELLLDRLIVDASARGQGVGGHLLAEVELVGARRGCRRGWLVCQAQGAADWYAGHGWAEDLRLPAWRHGRDFVRLTRSLRG